ncbi:hypothetical protein C8J57DRAFT_1724419 [Mycena rebaudengoi]|nr:hypothetical protein C8J57DRAFT_1724419 [Mycena rebaudengoi]
MDPSAIVFAAAPASVINLSPSAQAFVDNRVTSVGTWVLGAAIECLLMGIVFCQAEHYFRNQRRQEQFWTRTTMLVSWVMVLSMLKTTLVVKLVWQQSVVHFANPDVAMTLLYTAWCHRITPLTTGIIGFTVQSFYTVRFFRLTRNYFYTGLIVCAMLLGVVGGGMSEHYIAKAAAKEKLRWFLIHFISVTVADVLITIGTVTALYRRDTMMTNVVKRLTLLMFEAAIPPAIVATADLILTQVLGPKLILWHMPVNHGLGKLYPISLLYTLNTIGDNRELARRDARMASGNTHPRLSGRQGDAELQMADSKIQCRHGLNSLHTLNDALVVSFTSKPVQPWDRR